jgi:hypothetical protein
MNWFYSLPLEKKIVICDLSLQLIFNHKQYLKLKIYQEKNDKLLLTTIASGKWTFAMKNTCILIIYSYLDVSIQL